MCISLCITVVHNTAQNSSDNFPSCPPDNHHCSDDVYWRAGDYVSKRNMRRYENEWLTDWRTGA